MTKNPTNSPSRRPPHEAHRHGPARRSLRVLGILFVLLGGLASLSAQTQPDSPKVEVFGGYSYLLYDSKPLGFANPSSLQGWNFMVAYNLVRGFGVVAEASGDYGTHLNLRDVLVGPQLFHARGKYTYFGHLLVGKARSFDNVGMGDQDTQVAIELGGGIDRHFFHHLDFRIVQADYVHTKLFQVNQNNLQLSTGLVYHWHTIKWKPRKPPAAPKSP